MPARSFFTWLALADTTFAIRLVWSLAGCPLRAAALADGEEARAPALGACFLAPALLAALLLGVAFRTMSIISL